MSKLIPARSNTDAFDAIIVGGGAAGLMCAAALGQRQKKVLVIDHANKVGKKILMSGGGRCNFTNYEISSAHYISANPHFCKSALSRYTQYDFLDLVYRYEIPFHEKTKGQLFCDNKSKDILEMLLAECSRFQVQILTSTSILSIERHNVTENGTESTPPINKTCFTIETEMQTYQTSALVIATGGLSIPTMGATGFGYDIAKQFGLKVTAKHAALVPFTLGQPYLSIAQSLAGLSLAVDIATAGTHFQEQLLFTHKGLSGPAVLQISNYWWPDQAIEINFLPQADIEDIIAACRQEKSKKSLLNILAEHLPKRFVQTWLESHQDISALGQSTPNQLTTEDIGKIVSCFHHWSHVPKGTEGYKTAEVTRGGIDTDQISSKTFEAKKVPGLYFIGEVLDVTGWLGGYNFQWAWASGWCAAQHI